MKRRNDLLAGALKRVREIMPWDLRERLAQEASPLLIDVREPAEFALARIQGSINVPRGVLELACDWGFEETVPTLARGYDSLIVVVCRSGHRSALAADAMQQLGFVDVVSLRTGLRGWNDFEQALVDGDGQVVESDAAEQVLAPRVRPEQQRPR